MAAYVFIEIIVNDPVAYEDYKKLSTKAAEAYGGKFIIRGGKTEVLEGNWQPERVVVLEFPSIEKAHEWWNSEIYSEAKAIRQKAAETKMIVVEGI